MSYTERHIIDTYALLFNGLSSLSKIELIESLTKSLKKEEMEKEDTFYKSFGAFSNEKSTEEIVMDIKSNRKFKNKEINF